MNRAVVLVAMLALLLANRTSSAERLGGTSSIDLTVLIWGRVFERLSLIILAGITFYLGFRLLQQRGDEKSHLEAHAWDKFYFRLQNIGPGVFFAAFGAIIVVWSIWSPLSIEFPTYERSVTQRDLVPLAAMAKATIRYESPMANADSLPSDEGVLRSIRTIELLSDTKAKPNIDSGDRTALAKSSKNLELLRRDIIDKKFGPSSYEFWFVTRQSVLTSPNSVARLSESDRNKYISITELIETSW